MNRGPLASEATAQPTVPQPLPNLSTEFCVLKNDVFYSSSSLVVAPNPNRPPPLPTDVSSYEYSRAFASERMNVCSDYSIKSDDEVDEQRWGGGEGGDLIDRSAVQMLIHPSVTLKPTHLPIRNSLESTFKGQKYPLMSQYVKPTTLRR